MSENNLSPAVSVVMATYNGGDFVREQIESILNQTYKEFELIIVDDGSEPDTVSIIRAFSDRDERIKFHPSEKNLGFVRNFERGLNLAIGEYIALSDQDDIFHPQKIETQVNALLGEQSRDLVVSDLRLINENGDVIAESMWGYQKSKPMSGRPLERLLLSNFATGCAMMFRRRLLDLALPFPQDILVHDWWLAVVSSARSAGGILLIHKPLVDYRQHAENVIGAKPLRKLNINTAINGLLLTSQVSIEIEKIRRTWPTDLKRIEGYTSKAGVWNEKDLRQLKKTKSLYQGLSLDQNSSLMRRIIQLPFRLSCFFKTKRLRTCVMVTITTLWPSSNRID